MLRSLIVLITFLPAFSAWAQSTEKPDNPQTQTPAVSASVQYYRDPETGELTTPPPEVARSLKPDTANYSSEGLEMVVMPDGTKMVDLQGRFQMTSVIKTDGEGNQVYYCTSHPQGLTEAEHTALHAAPVER